MKWIVVIVALAACSKKSEPGTEDPKAACASAIQRGVDITLEKRRASGPMANNPDAQKVMDAVAPKLATSLTELCVADAWSSDVIKCFQTAADIATCKDRLEPEQRQKYSQEMMKVMLGNRGALGNPKFPTRTTVPIAPPSPVGSGSAP